MGEQREREEYNAQRREDERPCDGPTLEMRESRNGMGTFAKIQFRQDGLVWDWSKCRRYTKDQLPVPYIEDSYLQVAENLYLGPDGTPGEANDPGDVVNHSCNPNCMIYLDLPTIHLVALRDIAVGEEITYDYARTMYDDPWEMKCNCGTAKCRGVIRESDKVKGPKWPK